MLMIWYNLQGRLVISNPDLSYYTTLVLIIIIIIIKYHFVQEHVIETP